MDQSFVVYKLTRSEGNRMLHIEGEFTMKEINSLDFKPRDFNQVILTDQYAI
jgi:hypothetical protein